MRVNTAAMTHIIRSGLRTLHATPRMLRRYLSLKSFDTSCWTMKRSRCSTGYQASLRATSPFWAIAFVTVVKAAPPWVSVSG